jgi:hypothetical protein
LALQTGPEEFALLLCDNAIMPGLQRRKAGHQVLFPPPQPGVAMSSTQRIWIRTSRNGAGTGWAVATLTVRK